MRQYASHMPGGRHMTRNTCDRPILPGVIGISGSPRKRGNSDIILQYISRGMRERGIGCETFHLRDLEFQSCIGCERCRKDKICTGLKDDMRLIYPAILESNGLVLVSPTHTYNISALMKAFIDRLYCYYDFGDSRPRSWSSRLAGQGRKAVIAAVCEQQGRENMGVTLDAMLMPLEALGYEVVDEIAVFGLFDRGIVKDHPDILARSVEAGRRLGDCLAQGRR